MQVFGLLLAAIVHDIAHPGVTNDFLAKTGDARVAAHGVASPNEKHHLATAFAVASQDATNVFAGLSPAEEEQVGPESSYLARRISRSFQCHPADQCLMSHKPHVRP